MCVQTNGRLYFPLQFDEEFSARQEAQAESQKKEERIKELEEKIQALESQVNPSQRKKCIEMTLKIELQPVIDLSKFKFTCPPKNNLSQNNPPVEVDLM